MIRSRVLSLLVIVVLGAACSGRQSSAANPSNAQLRDLAARYSAIATVGNQGLDRAFTALDGPDRDHLPAARADLDAAATTERGFDRSLLAIVFPSAIEATVAAVVRVNETRANLTAHAAASTSLQQLRGYNPRLSAANDAVVQQVRTLRKQLGLPPAETS
jgi:hypothetical protein